MKKLFTILCTVGLLTSAKAQQAPNSSFDTWSTIYTPDSWSTIYNASDLPNGAGPFVAPLAVQDNADKVQGTSSIKLSTAAIPQAGNVSGFVGLGTNSLAGGYSGIAFPYRPDTLFFAYKYVPSGTDTAVMQIFLTKAGAVLIGGAVNLLSTANAWVNTYVPLTALYANGNTPDTLSLEFINGRTAAQVGSILRVDAVRFGYVAAIAPPVATVTPAGPVNICAGGSGQVLTAGTGTGYSYVWSNNGTPITPAATGGTYTATATGTYTVKVTSTGGTASSTGVSVTLNPKPSATPSATQSSCAGTTGTVIANATGGTGTLAYVWSTNPAQNSATATGLGAGSYTVTVTDSKTCKVTASATITNPNPPIASLGATTAPTCSYSTNGQATVTATGGSGSGYTFTWSNGGTTTATKSNLAGGTTYTVTVKDGLSCAATAAVSINLTAPTVVSATSSNVKDVKCKGGNNGTATLAGTGGTAGYTFTWAAGVTGAAQTALTAKTYNVTVTDSKSCTAVVPVNIAEPAASLTATTSKTITTATALPVGGTSPYTYTWSTSPVQSAVTATGLAKGTYTVTVKDANLCTTTATVTVTGPTSIETISAGIASLNVYPNPSNGVFNLEVNLKDASDLTISVTDIAGRKSYETMEKNVTELTKQISLTSLSKGIYIVTIKTATGSVNQRIVIE